MNKYLGTESGLIGPVTMEKPSINDHLYISRTNGEEKLNVQSWLEAGDLYHKALSSLPRIPCEGWKPEDGRDYTLGIHFLLINMLTGKECYSQEEIGYAPNGLLAVPPPTAPEDTLTPEEFGAYVQDAVPDIPKRHKTPPFAPAAPQEGAHLIEKHRTLSDVLAKRIANTDDEILKEAYTRWLDVLNDLIEGDRGTLLKAFGIIPQPAPEGWVRFNEVDISNGLYDVWVEEITRPVRHYYAGGRWINQEKIMLPEYYGIEFIQPIPQPPKQ